MTALVITQRVDPELRVVFDGEAVRYEVKPSKDDPWIAVNRDVYLGIVATMQLDATIEQNDHFYNINNALRSGR